MAQGKSSAVAVAAFAVNREASVLVPAQTPTCPRPFSSFSFPICKIQECVVEMSTEVLCHHSGSTRLLWLQKDTFFPAVVTYSRP